SRARAMNLGTETQIYLNNLLVRAHNQVYQTKQNRWADLFNFLCYGFPALVRKHILYTAAAVLIFAAPTAIGFFMTLQDVHFAQLEVSPHQPIVSDEMWDMIEHKKMWTDAVQDNSAPMSSLIATNN